MKLLQNKEMQGAERVAAKLRYFEKLILTETMSAVRRRLAPIRGGANEYRNTLRKPNKGNQGAYHQSRIMPKNTTSFYRMRPRPCGDDKRVPCGMLRVYEYGL